MVISRNLGHRIDGIPRGHEAWSASRLSTEAAIARGWVDKWPGHQIHAFDGPCPPLFTGYARTYIPHVADRRLVSNRGRSKNQMSDV